MICVHLNGVKLLILLLMTPNKLIAILIDKIEGDIKG